MQDDIDDIVNQWKKAKQALPREKNVDELIAQAEQKRKASLSFHYGNMIVLVIVIVMLVLSFLFFFPFQETVSRVGVVLMVGSLVTRIVIEFYSVQKSRSINLSVSALSNTDLTVAFYNFRKRVHGPVTISIVTIYCMGLAMLTPEFLKHVGPVIYLFDGMFCIGGAVLIWQIRKGIQKEMKDLRELMKIRTQLTD
jgi:hypothetical protein